MNHNYNCQSENECESRCEKQCDHCKTYYAPLDERMKHECEFFLMTDIAAYACECDRITIGDKEYVPIEKLS